LFEQLVLSVVFVWLVVVWWFDWLFYFVFALLFDWFFAWLVDWLCYACAIPIQAQMWVNVCTALPSNHKGGCPTKPCNVC
jgi:hypothetical protein